MAAPAALSTVLMGLRGSGKSTLGAALAQRREQTFIDLDDRTARVLGGGLGVGAAFKTFGEPAFRQAETGALRDVFAEAPGVIALGGGTPTAPGAADILRAAQAAERILIVYLRAEPGTLRERLAASDQTSRPSLTGAGVLDEIGAVFAARDPVYRELADVIITVDGHTPEQVLALLCAI